MKIQLLARTRSFLGAVLVVAPEAILGRLTHRPVSAGERTVARLIGARNLVEAAAVIRFRSHRHGWLLAGAAVDSTHAVSMVVLAAVRPEHRRLATASALAATATATAGVVAAHRQR